MSKEEKKDKTESILLKIISPEVAVYIVFAVMFIIGFFIIN